MTVSKSCPCQSGEAYAKCCKPYHDRLPAPTALALMRSRYTAYATHNIDYIFNTTHPSTREAADRDAAKEWAVQSQWLGLQIVATQAGSEADTEGIVEFIARFASDEKVHLHHERSRFCKVDGRWYYLQAEPTDTAPAPKQGRNTLCSCGSGKKYKHCHGA